MPEAIKAVIFDMDGVLVDSESLHERSWQLALKKFGVDMPISMVAPLKGVPAVEIVKLLTDKYGLADSLHPEIVKEKQAAYRLLAEKELKPIEGAIEFVKLCRAKFEKLGLVTSSIRVHVDHSLEKIGLAGIFDSETTVENIKKGKPDPEPYQIACKQLAISSKKAVVIEDAVNGVKSGKSAGCTVVAITTSYPGQVLVTSGADIVVDSFSELKEHEIFNEA